MASDRLFIPTTISSDNTVPHSLLSDASASHRRTDTVTWYPAFSRVWRISAWRAQSRDGHAAGLSNHMEQITYQMLMRRG